MRALYDAVYNRQQYDRMAEFLEPDYREHNLFIEDGIPASIEHQKQMGGYPNVIQRVIEDGELLCIHSRYCYEPHDYAVMDIWRINRAGKGVEHWDSLTAMTTPDADRLLEGPDCSSAQLTSEERAARIATMRDYLDVAIRRKDRAMLDRLLAPDFVDHNIGHSWFPDVRSAAESEVLLDSVHILGAGGDMAFSWSDYSIGGKPRHVAEIFRFDDQGRIAEHWDAADFHPKGAAAPRAVQFTSLPASPERLPLAGGGTRPSKESRA